MNHLFCSLGLNDLEEFGRFEADEKSISRQLPRSQMLWKTLESPGLNQRHQPDRKVAQPSDRVDAEILFSSASNLPNSSKSFNTTVPPHIVPMYFKCSVYWRPSLRMPLAGGLAFPSWAEDIWTPKFLWQLKKIIKFGGIRHLKFKNFSGELPQIGVST